MDVDKLAGEAVVAETEHGTLEILPNGATTLTLPSGQQIEVYPALLLSLLRSGADQSSSNTGDSDVTAIYGKRANAGITAEPIPTEAINQIGVSRLDISQVTAERPARSKTQQKS